MPLLLVQRNGFLGLLPIFGRGLAALLGALSLRAGLACAARRLAALFAKDLALVFHLALRPATRLFPTFALRFCLFLHQLIFGQVCASRLEHVLVKCSKASE